MAWQAAARLAFCCSHGTPLPCGRAGGGPDTATECRGYSSGNLQSILHLCRWPKTASQTSAARVKFGRHGVRFRLLSSVARAGRSFRRPIFRRSQNDGDLLPPRVSRTHADGALVRVHGHRRRGGTRGFPTLPALPPRTRPGGSACGVHRHAVGTCALCRDPCARPARGHGGGSRRAHGLQRTPTAPCDPARFRGDARGNRPDRAPPFRQKTPPGNQPPGQHRGPECGVRQPAAFQRPGAYAATACRPPRCASVPRSGLCATRCGCVSPIVRRWRGGSFSNTSPVAWCPASSGYYRAWTAMPERCASGTGRVGSASENRRANRS